MNRNQCEKIFQVLEAFNPNPRTELNYSSHFELLIAVVLSAQTTDVSVNKSTELLFKVANTPEKILSLGEKNLRNYIKSVGLYRKKARSILKICCKLITQHGGKVPSTREELEALSGVGRKTANVVLNIAFGFHTIAVDTHIFRVSNRTRLAPGKTPLSVEKKLLKIIPKAYRYNAHHWLVLHGRYICRARSPKCAQCPIYECCHWTGKK